MSRLAPRRTALLLVLLALCARASFLVALLVAEPVLVDVPLLDAAHYHAWAKDILAGTGLAREVYFMHPLPPALMAAVYAVFGAKPVAYLGLQIVLGAFGVGFLYGVGRRTFGEVAAVVAGVMAALYRPFLWNDVLLETVEPALFFMLLAIWLVTSASERRRRTVALVGAGAAWALACLCRGNLLLGAPVLAVAACLDGAGDRARRLVAGAAPVLLGMALVFGGVGLRNRTVGGEWVFTTASAGAVLYLSHHAGVSVGAHEPPAFLRPDPRFEEHDWRAEAERRAGRAMPSAKERSRFWRGEAWRAVADDPGRSLRLAASKLGLAVAAYELADNYNLAYLDHVAGVAAVPLPAFALVFPLAVLGAVLAWPRRRALVVPYGLGAAYLVSLAVFYVSSRLRTPLVPVLMLFAGHGVVQLVEWIRARRWAPLGAAVLACGVLTIASLRYVPDDVRSREWAQAQNGHAGALASSGRVSEARALYLDALARAPGDGRLHLNAGLAAYRAGDRVGAVRLCGEAARLLPGVADAHGCLGVALAQLGPAHAAAAEVALRQAQALAPDDPERSYNLAVLFTAQGRLAEARAFVERTLALAPGHAGARSLAARVGLTERP